jgi:Tfp pilus assembly protein PilO
LINHEVDKFVQELNDQTAEMEESFNLLEKQLLNFLK